MMTGMGLGKAGVNVVTAPRASARGAIEEAAPRWTSTTCLGLHCCDISILLSRCKTGIRACVIMQIIWGTL
jgi:hypothetical protein